MRLIKHSKPLVLHPFLEQRKTRVYEDPLYSKIWDILKERGWRWSVRPEHVEIDRSLLRSVESFLETRAEADVNMAVRVYTGKRAKHCEHVTMLLWQYVVGYRMTFFNENCDFAYSLVHMLIRRGLRVRMFTRLFKCSGAAFLIQMRWSLYKQTKAAKKIQKQFRLWRWRKNCLWNPHTTTGRNNLVIRSRAAAHLS